MTNHPRDAVTSKWVFVLVLTMLCLGCMGALAQVSPPRACAQLMNDIATQGALAGTTFSDLTLHGGAVVCFWESALAKVPMSTALQAQAALQKSSSATQTGASTASNGTTSAVSKPFTPLSLATEYGGITSSTSNQTITLQSSLDGIPAALSTKGLKPYCWSPVITIPGCVQSGTLQALSRFGIGVTANTAGSSQNVTGAATPSKGTAQQATLSKAGTTSLSLSGVFAKWTILRGKYEPDSTTKVDLKGEPVVQAQRNIVKALREFPNDVYDEDNPNSSYQQWKHCIETTFTAGALQDVSARNALFAKYWVQLTGVLFSSGTVSCSADAPVLADTDLRRPAEADRDAWQKTAMNPGASPREIKLAKARLDFLNAVDGYLAAVSIFESQSDQLLLASAPALSFEYDYNSPLNQPTTSTAKLVFSYSGWKRTCPGKKNAAGKDSKPSSMNRLTGTINAGANFYNSEPSAVPGAGLFRDAQAGVEADYAICTSNAFPLWSLLGNATFGLTYYYQDQVSPSILKVASAGAPLSGIGITGLSSTATKVFATKGPINFVQLKYGLGTGKNVKFPIAVSWSNRTDLITHSLWSAQFGVSYNFSSFLTSSSSASKPASGDSQ